MAVLAGVVEAEDKVIRSIYSMINITPSISVTLYLTADEFSLDDVTRKMGILPTQNRVKDSFPPQSIAAGIAQTGWVLEIKEEHCLAVSILFERMIDMLSGKEEIINNVQNDYGIEASFSVSIHMHEAANPEIWLPQEAVKFAASINASIGFDIYSYCSCADNDEIILTDDGYFKIGKGS